MCGIVGSFGIGSTSSEIEVRVPELKHRGPDHQGFESFGEYCHMGVARLAMTDPFPRSNQPMYSKANNASISFNGEIYNFRELRQNLIDNGQDFKTESDTEVLLEYLAKYGNQGLGKLQGMFAIAFFDEVKQSILLARDFLGKKPLYFSMSNGILYWASSSQILKSILQKQIDNLESRFDFLSLGYTLDPNSSYVGVHALLPGHFLEIKLGNPVIHQTRISTLPKRFLEQNSLRELIWEAIKVRTQGHSQVAISLSGGIDSSIIALGLRELGVETEAFSVFWSDSDKDRYNSDKNHAELIAKELGHRFTPVDVSAGFNLEDQLRKYLLAMEEPSNNPTGLSMFTLYEKIAKQGHRLTLTGDGSDEIFAGYQRHSSLARVPNLLKLDSSIYYAPLFNRKSKLTSLISNLVATQFSQENPLAWLHWHWVFNPAELNAIIDLPAGSDGVVKSISQQIRRLSECEEKQDRVEILMQRDHEVWLTMESNRKLDRISMAHSVEARSPFQDETVINFANLAMKRTSFRQLRKVNLVREFPELQALPIKNEKVGFTSPIGHWMRSNQLFVSDSLLYLKSLNGWNKSGIDDFIDSQFKGSYKTNLQLWTLVVYSNWLRIQSE